MDREHPPHFLFILADDLGSWGLGCAGHPDIKTPNLDCLAARGVLFDNAFCVSPVCSPARASILTGLIPSYHGVHDWIRVGNSAGESQAGIVLDYLEGQVLYTDVLAGAGYDCALAGKWHLGQCAKPRLGHIYWNVHASGHGPYFKSKMINHGEEYVEPKYLTEAITDRGIDFLKSRSQADKPFYLGVHYTAPHSPWDRVQHPSELFDAYDIESDFVGFPEAPPHPWQINTAPVPRTAQERRETLAGYCAAVTAMDEGIGRLVNQLDAMGIRDDTVVIFTSDNGMNMGHHGIWGKGNGTFPQNVYDTSVKVPMIVAGSGIKGEGRRSDALVSHYDLFPTILELAGTGTQDERMRPGKSLVPILSNSDAEKESLGHIIVLNEYATVRMLRTSYDKYVERSPRGPNEYYNLILDPEETMNLYRDPNCQGRIEELRSRLEAWFRDHARPGFEGSALEVWGRGQMSRLDGIGRHFEADWCFMEAPSWPRR
jgi:arylsulfatase A-like enzyme